MKQRSKFFPAARLIITNSIIKQNINITKAIDEQYIMDFFPIHDPFILKNIKLYPYIKVIKNLIK